MSKIKVIIAKLGICFHEYGKAKNQRTVQKNNNLTFYSGYCYKECKKCGHKEDLGY